MAPSFDHINVVVSDMPRAQAFYAVLLDLAPVMDRELSGPWFEGLTGLAGARARCLILDRPEGGMRIELLEFAGNDGTALEALRRPATIGLRHFALRVIDLDHRLDILRRRFGQNLVPIQVPIDIVQGGKRMCYCHDPDGTIIELCEYGSDRPVFCP